MLPLNLKPVEEAKQDILDTHENYIKYTTQNERNLAQAKIEKMEKNRLVIPELMEFLEPWELEVWNHGATVCVRLGNIHNNSVKEKVRKATRCLGPLRHWSKEAKDEKTFIVQLRPRNFPGVSLYYERNAKPHDRCKIVAEESKYLTVVCER